MAVVKSNRKKNETIRTLKDMNHLRQRVIETRDDTMFKTIRKGKRYMHKFKGGSRMGVCVGWQPGKPLVLFDDSEDGKAKPLLANQLIAAGDSGDDALSMDEYD